MGLVYWGGALRVREGVLASAQVEYTNPEDGWGLPLRNTSRRNSKLCLPGPESERPIWLHFGASLGAPARYGIAFLPPALPWVNVPSRCTHRNMPSKEPAEPALPGPRAAASVAPLLPRETPAPLGPACQPWSSDSAPRHHSVFNQTLPRSLPPHSLGGLRAH